MGVIPLINSITKFAIVDDEDYQRILNFGIWRLYIDDFNLYAQTYRHGKTYSMHSVVTRIFNRLHDHKNRNGLDNQKKNLRIATYQQNSFNCRINKNNLLGKKGIKYDSRYNNYQARIMKSGICYSKVFSTIEEAIEWRKQKEIELHGEFASNLN